MILRWLMALSVSALLCGRVAFPLELTGIEPSGSWARIVWSPPTNRAILEVYTTLDQSGRCEAFTTGQTVNSLSLPLPDTPHAFIRAHGGLHVVRFASTGLAAAAWRSLSRPKTEPINELYDVDTLAIQTLLAGQSGISNFDGLQHLAGVTSADFNDNPVADVSPLAAWSQLRELNLNYCRAVTNVGSLRSLERLYIAEAGLSNITFLAGLTNLTVLIANMNAISNLAPLSNMRRLQELELFGNQITNVAPLATLTNLVTLLLGNNRLTNVAPLAALTHLQALNLMENSVSNLSALAGLTNLIHLNAHFTGLSDVGPFSNMVALQTLEIGENQIKDITPLQRLTNLTTLGMAANRISNVNVIAGMTGLTDLRMAANPVTNFAPIGALTNLISLSIELCSQPQTLAPLSNLTHLGYLYARYCAITNLEPLSSLLALRMAQLDGNLITDLAPLVANAAAGGLGPNDKVYLYGNPLTPYAQTNQIPLLRDTYGVQVYWAP